MKRIIVSVLWYTLIKGTRGIWVTAPGATVEVNERGIKNDRRWMVVNEAGMFVTQRSSGGMGVSIRSMCQVVARIVGNEMALEAPEMREFRLPLEKAVAPIVTVQVWNNASLSAVDEGEAVAAWFTEFLSRERAGTYRLVRMTNDCRRPSKKGEALVGFHDSYPFMFISNASLGSLNGRLLNKGEKVVQASRFRPNIWVAGCDAHAEDFFQHIRIGYVELHGKTLCDRCTVTCINQETGELGKEPLSTLAEYRKGAHLAKCPGYEDQEGLGIASPKGGAIFFGKNFEHQSTGFMTVGSSVEIL